MTLDELERWIRCFVITDEELIDLPEKLIVELSKPFRKRYTNLKHTQLRS